MTVPLKTPKKNPFESLYLDLVYKDHPLAGWVPRSDSQDYVEDENIYRIQNYYGTRFGSV